MAALILSLWQHLKTDRATQVVLLVIVLGCVAFGVKQCSGRDAANQAKQTNRSGVAISRAAQEAVDTVSNRSEADLAIDAAVDQAKEEIGNASNSAAIRDTVVRHLCVRPEYRLDPACSMRGPDPR